MDLAAAPIIRDRVHVGHRRDECHPQKRKFAWRHLPRRSAPGRISCGGNCGRSAMLPMTRCVGGYRGSLPCWQDFGRFRPGIDQVWPSVCRLRPTWRDGDRAFGPKLARHRLNLGRHFGRICPKYTGRSRDSCMCSRTCLASKNQVVRANAQGAPSLQAGALSRLPCGLATSQTMLA